MNSRKQFLTILGLTMALVIVISSVLLTTPLVAQVRKPAVTVAPTQVFPDATPTQEQATAFASISGLVWHDLCAPGDAPLIPSPGCVAASGGGYRANGLLESVEPGLGSVLVQLGVGACPAMGLAAANSSMNGTYVLEGLEAGTYCVSVDALRPENALLLLPGDWTFPAASAESRVASYTVTLLEGERLAGINFGWDYQFLPLPEPLPTAEPAATATALAPQPTASATPVLPTPGARCSDEAVFVKDVTIPDATRLLPGQSFVKTWRLRNSGDCVWSGDYALVFVGGDRLEGAAAAPLAGPVAPGSTVDLSVALTAPAGNGDYQGKWQLQNSEGKLFGIGKNADAPFWVKIVVGPAPQPTVTPVISNWRGEYYANPNLTGNPVLVRNDAEINFSWGDAAPLAGLPNDGFSVRWTRAVPLQGGAYRFYARSDDGVRVWLDGELIINEWRDGAAAAYSAERVLNAASHTLRVEYYENNGAAQVQFWWERLGDLTGWSGAYYPNVDLSGVATLLRNDPEINFNWGRGAPATGLPSDGFSARWTRIVAFDEGLYRFHASVDDGVRLWVDDALVLDDWYDGGGHEATSDHQLSGVFHTVRVEYYERSGDALLKVWWERISPVSYSDWKGEYWSNPTLNGSPALVRNDAGVDFDWGRNSPASNIPADNFSARWTRTLAFDKGLYRFYIAVDDGARLWVDNALVVDDWRDGERRWISGDSLLAAGYHTVRVEYYERGGYASSLLWWERVDAYPDWRGEYWSNPTLSGEPVLVRNDVNIDFNWGQNAPAAGLPADNFSARWTRAVNFDADTYRFRVIVDDGARLYVDERLVIDAWRDGAAREVTADIPLVAGKHNLRLEFYERAGDARIRLWWEKITPTFSEWKGEYWSNRNLSGGPSLLRNDKEISFQWENGAPAVGLPVDKFSARWSRQVIFAPGVYRFSARVDDGMRFYLNGDLLLNEWRDNDGSRVYTVDQALSGSRSLVVEYYENGGKALVSFGWKRIADLPTPTPTPTLTPTPTPVPPTATPTPTPEPPTPTATPTPVITTTAVWLNEVLPAPSVVDWDGDGVADERDEWIELYNSSAITIELGGWRLDNGVSSYLLPVGTALQPRALVVLYRQQTGLVLDDSGGSVRLTGADGKVVDSVILGALAPDASFSRGEDDLWHLDWPPSPGRPNLPTGPALIAPPGEAGSQ